jgi:hypothetical protein
MSLIDLLALCTARIAPRNSLGTGFFVAPGLVLTCRHVVQDVADGQPVPVFWQGQEYQARVQERTPYPYPDLALLILPDLAGQHPCVWLGASEPRPREYLHTYGYRADYPEGSPASFEYEGLARGSEPLLTFKLGDVQPGQSGSPLLDLGRGVVCGIIPVSRGPHSLLGGRAVPTDMIFQHFPALVEAQRQFHARDQRWQQARAAEEQTKRLAGLELDAIARLYREKLLHFPLITHVQVLRMNSGIPLEALYIRLRLSSRWEQGRRERADDEESGPKDPALDYQRRQERLEQRFSASFEPVQAVRQFRHCVFLGEPGAGKTTLLKYLASQALLAQAEGMPLVPIYVSLSDFARGGASDLTAFAASQFAQRFQLEARALLAYFRELIERREALFLLDALDEVASGPPRAGAQDYQQVVDAIENLSGHCEYIVLTARRAGYHQRRVPRVFTELEVLDFRRSDIEQFIEQWFRARQPVGWPRKIEEFIGRLRAEKNTSLLTLAANPLLLTQLALVFEWSGDLPQKRFHIYKECTELVQRGWDNARGLVRAHELSMDEEIELLRELAWQTHRQRRRSLSADECGPLIVAQLQSLNRADLTPSQVLQELSNARGLLRDVGDEQYAFVHFTFQEYFTAQHLKEANHEQDLLTVLGDPWWEEVILLYAGAVYDASSLLAHLLAASDPAGPPEDVFLSKLILAGRCLAEQATVRQPELRQRIIERLFRELEGAEYRFPRQHLADTLAEIGRAAPRVQDDPVNARLLRYASPAQSSLPPSWDLQRAILDALALFGSSALAPALLDLLILRADEGFRLWNALYETILSLAQPDEEIYGRLFNLARDPRMESSLAAHIARLLAYTGNEAATTALFAEFKNPALSERVQDAFAFSLVMLGQPRAIEELLAFIEQHFSFERLTLSIVLDGIRARHLTGMVPLLLQLLERQKGSPIYYGSLARVLQEIGSSEIVPRLLPFLRDKALHPIFRGEFASACASLGGQLYRRELLALVADRAEDARVRCQLLLGLVETADDELRARLYELYRAEPGGTVRATLLLVCGLLGEPLTASGKAGPPPGLFRCSRAGRTRRPASAG